MLGSAAWYVAGCLSKYLADKILEKPKEQSLERPQDETNQNVTFSTEIKHELKNGATVTITQHYEAKNNDKTTGNGKKKKRQKKKKNKQVSIIFSMHMQD